MRRWVLWLNVLERRLWGDALQGNPYFASLVLTLAMFGGAALCERGLLMGLIPAFVGVNGVAIAGLLVILSGFLLCESIFVGKGIDVVIIRTLALMMLSAFVAVAGYLLGWPLLLFSIVWLLSILVFIFIDLRRR